MGKIIRKSKRVVHIEPIRTSPYINLSGYEQEINDDIHNTNYQKPIVDDFLEKIRKKLLIDVRPDESEITPARMRQIIYNDIIEWKKKTFHSKLSAGGIVETLVQEGDLKTFYTFGKAFLNQINERLDAYGNANSAFLDLWNFYKNSIKYKAQKYSYPPSNYDQYDKPTTSFFGLTETKPQIEPLRSQFASSTPFEPLNEAEEEGKPPFVEVKKRGRKPGSRNKAKITEIHEPTPGGEGFKHMRGGKIGQPYFGRR